MRENKNLQWISVLVFVIAIVACNLPSSLTANNIATPTITTSQSVGETSAKLTLVTGDDGTTDNPVFELFDKSGNVVFTVTLDQQADLQPNQTDVYEFIVPHPFCQMIAWQITKPSGTSIDDPWLPKSITLEMDGKMVWLDGLFSDLGSITLSSQRGGNWSDIEIYKQQCGK